MTREGPHMRALSARASDVSEGGRSATTRLAGSMVALEPLVDRQLGVGRDFSSDSDTMLIAFAAMAATEPPPFHFFEFTCGMAAKRLFVRDPWRIWFQRGVPGFGDTIDEVAGSLSSIVGEQEPDRLIVVGSSAG